MSADGDDAVVFYGAFQADKGLGCWESVADWARRHYRENDFDEISGCLQELKIDGIFLLNLDDSDKAEVIKVSSLKAFKHLMWFRKVLHVEFKDWLAAQKQKDEEMGVSIDPRSGIDGTGFVEDAIKERTQSRRKSGGSLLRRRLSEARTSDLAALDTTRVSFLSVDKLGGRPGGLLCTIDVSNDAQVSELADLAERELRVPGVFEICTSSLETSTTNQDIPAGETKALDSKIYKEAKTPTKISNVSEKGQKRKWMCLHTRTVLLRLKGEGQNPSLLYGTMGHVVELVGIACGTQGNARGNIVDIVGPADQLNAYLTENSSAKNMLNLLDCLGMAPLHYAVKFRNYDVALSLVENGASIQVRDSRNRVPIYYLFMNDFTEKAYDIAKRIGLDDLEHLEERLHDSVLFSVDDNESTPIEIAMRDAPLQKEGWALNLIDDYSIIDMMRVEQRVQPQTLYMITLQEEILSIISDMYVLMEARYCSKGRSEHGDVQLLDMLENLDKHTVVTVERCPPFTWKLRKKKPLPKSKEGDENVEFVALWVNGLHMIAGFAYVWHKGGNNELNIAKESANHLMDVYPGLQRDVDHEENDYSGLISVSIYEPKVNDFPSGQRKIHVDVTQFLVALIPGMNSDLDNIRYIGSKSRSERGDVELLDMLENLDKHTVVTVERSDGKNSFIWTQGATPQNVDENVEYVALWVNGLHMIAGFAYVWHKDGNNELNIAKESANHLMDVYPGLQRDVDHEEKDYSGLISVSIYEPMLKRFPSGQRKIHVDVTQFLVALIPGINPSMDSVRQWQCIQALMFRYFELPVYPYGATLVHLCCMHSVDMLKRLNGGNGVDLSVRDQRGWTVFHFCAYANNQDVLEYLLGKMHGPLDVSPFDKSFCGKSSFDVALEQDSWDCVSAMLRKYGGNREFYKTLDLSNCFTMAELMPRDNAESVLKCDIDKLEDLSGVPINRLNPSHEEFSPSYLRTLGDDCVYIEIRICDMNIGGFSMTMDDLIGNGDRSNIGENFFVQSRVMKHLKSLYPNLTIEPCKNPRVPVRPRCRSERGEVHSDDLDVGENETEIDLDLRGPHQASEAFPVPEHPPRHSPDVTFDSEMPVEDCASNTNPNQESLRIKVKRCWKVGNTRLKVKRTIQRLIIADVTSLFHSMAEHSFERALSQSITFRTFMQALMFRYFELPVYPYGATLVHLCCMHSVDMLKRLNGGNGVDLSVRDQRGWTVFHFCAYANNQDVLEYLLGKMHGPLDVSPFDKNFCGKSSLDVALERHFFDFAYGLLQSTENEVVDIEYCIPATIAVCRMKTRCVGMGNLQWQKMLHLLFRRVRKDSVRDALCLDEAVGDGLLDAIFDTRSQDVLQAALTCGLWFWHRSPFLYAIQRRYDEGIRVLLNFHRHMCESANPIGIDISVSILQKRWERCFLVSRRDIGMLPDGSLISSLLLHANYSDLVYIGKLLRCYDSVDMFWSESPWLAHTRLIRWKLLENGKLVVQEENIDGTSQSYPSILSKQDKSEPVTMYLDKIESIDDDLLYQLSLSCSKRYSFGAGVAALERIQGSVQHHFEHSTFDGGPFAYWLKGQKNCTNVFLQHCFRLGLHVCEMRYTQSPLEMIEILIEIALKPHGRILWCNDNAPRLAAMLKVLLDRVSLSASTALRLYRLAIRFSASQVVVEILQNPKMENFLPSFYNATGKSLSVKGFERNLLPLAYQFSNFSTRQGSSIVIVSLLDISTPSSHDRPHKVVIMVNSLGYWDPKMEPINVNGMAEAIVNDEVFIVNSVPDSKSLSLMRSSLLRSSFVPKANCRDAFIGFQRLLVLHFSVLLVQHSCNETADMKISVMACLKGLVRCSVELHSDNVDYLLACLYAALGADTGTNEWSCLVETVLWGIEYLVLETCLSSEMEALVWAKLISTIVMPKIEDKQLIVRRFLDILHLHGRKNEKIKMHARVNPPKLKLPRPSQFLIQEVGEITTSGPIGLLCCKHFDIIFSNVLEAISTELVSEFKLAYIISLYMCKMFSSIDVVFAKTTVCDWFLDKRVLSSISRPQLADLIIPISIAWDIDECGWNEKISTCLCRFQSEDCPFQTPYWSSSVRQWEKASQKMVLDSLLSILKRHGANIWKSKYSAKALTGCSKYVAMKDFVFEAMDVLPAGHLSAETTIVLWANSVRANNMELVERMLGIQILKPSLFPSAWLHLSSVAASRGYDDVAMKFFKLEQEARKNILWIAALHNRPELARRNLSELEPSLKWKALIEPDVWGLNAFHYAAGLRNIETLHVLMSEYQNLDANSTPDTFNPLCNPISLDGYDDIAEEITIPSISPICLFHRGYYVVRNRLVGEDARCDPSPYKLRWLFKFGSLREIESVFVDAVFCVGDSLEEIGLCLDGESVSFYEAKVYRNVWRRSSRIEAEPRIEAGPSYMTYMCEKYGKSPQDFGFRLDVSRAIVHCAKRGYDSCAVFLAKSILMPHQYGLHRWSIDALVIGCQTDCEELVKFLLDEIIRCSGGSEGLRDYFEEFGVSHSGGLQQLISNLCRMSFYYSSSSCYEYLKALILKMSLPVYWTRCDNIFSGFVNGWYGVAHIADVPQGECCFCRLPIEGDGKSDLQPPSSFKRWFVEYLGQSETNSDIALLSPSVHDIVEELLAECDASMKEFRRLNQVARRPVENYVQLHLGELHMRLKRHHERRHLQLSTLRMAKDFNMALFAEMRRIVISEDEPIGTCSGKLLVEIPSIALPSQSNREASGLRHRRLVWISEDNPWVSFSQKEMFMLRANLTHKAARLSGDHPLYAAFIMYQSDVIWEVGDAAMLLMENHNTTAVTYLFAMLMDSFSCPDLTFAMRNSIWNVVYEVLSFAIRCGFEEEGKAIIDVIQEHWIFSHRILPIMYNASLFNRTSIVQKVLNLFESKGLKRKDSEVSQHLAAKFNVDPQDGFSHFLASLALVSLNNFSFSCFTMLHSELQCLKEGISIMTSLLGDSTELERHSKLICPEQWVECGRLVSSSVDVMYNDFESVAKLCGGEDTCSLDSPSFSVWQCNNIVYTKCCISDNEAKNKKGRNEAEVNPEVQPLVNYVISAGKLRFASCKQQGGRDVECLSLVLMSSRSNVNPVFLRVVVGVGVLTHSIVASPSAEVGNHGEYLLVAQLAAHRNEDSILLDADLSERKEYALPVLFEKIVFGPPDFRCHSVSKAFITTIAPEGSLAGTEPTTLHLTPASTSSKLWPLFRFDHVWSDILRKIMMKYTQLTSLYLHLNVDVQYIDIQNLHLPDNVKKVDLEISDTWFIESVRKESWLPASSRSNLSDKSEERKNLISEFTLRLYCASPNNDNALLVSMSTLTKIGLMAQTIVLTTASNSSSAWGLLLDCDPPSRCSLRIQSCMAYVIPTYVNAEFERELAFFRRNNVRHRFREGMQFVVFGTDDKSFTFTTASEEQNILGDGKWPRHERSTHDDSVRIEPTLHTSRMEEVICGDSSADYGFVDERGNMDNTPFDVASERPKMEDYITRSPSATTHSSLASGVIFSQENLSWRGTLLPSIFGNSLADSLIGLMAPSDIRKSDIALYGPVCRPQNYSLFSYSSSLLSAYFSPHVRELITERTESVRPRVHSEQRLSAMETWTLLNSLFYCDKPTALSFPLLAELPQRDKVDEIALDILKSIAEGVMASLECRREQQCESWKQLSEVLCYDQPSKSLLDLVKKDVSRSGIEFDYPSDDDVTVRAILSFCCTAVAHCCRLKLNPGEFNAGRNYPLLASVVWTMTKSENYSVTCECERKDKSGEPKTFENLWEVQIGSQHSYVYRCINLCYGMWSQPESVSIVFSELSCSSIFFCELMVGCIYNYNLKKLKIANECIDVTSTHYSAASDDDEVSRWNIIMICWRMLIRTIGENSSIRKVDIKKYPGKDLIGKRPSVKGVFVVPTFKTGYLSNIARKFFWGNLLKSRVNRIHGLEEFYLNWLDTTTEAKVSQYLVGLDLPENITSIANAWSYIVESRDKKSVVSNRMKLMFVGVGNQGKTTLLRRLAKDDFKEGYQDSTDGVDVSTFSLRNPKKSKPATNTANEDADSVEAHDKHALYFSAWDFGGQAVYHATHPYFFSDDCCYLVVARCRETPDIARYSQFFYTINAKAPNSPVILVLTGAKEASESSIDRLIQEFEKHDCRSQYQGYVKVDSRTGHGIEILKKKLWKLAKKMPAVNKLVPQSCIHAAQWFRTLKKETVSPVLDRESFEKLLHDNAGVPLSRTAMVVDTLSSWGSVVTFNGDGHRVPMLSNAVVLDPQWIADVLSCIVTGLGEKTNIEGAFSNGIIQHKWMKDIFWANYFPVEARDGFIQLLHSYELAFEIPNQKPERSLVPAMISLDPPKGARFPDKATITSKCDYYVKFISDEMIPRLIFRLQKSLSEECIVWKRGIFLVSKRDPDNAKLVLEIKERTEGSQNCFLHIKMYGKNLYAKAMLRAQVVDALQDLLVQSYGDSILRGDGMLMHRLLCLNNKPGCSTGWFDQTDKIMSGPYNNFEFCMMIVKNIPDEYLANADAFVRFQEEILKDYRSIDESLEFSYGGKHIKDRFQKEYYKEKWDKKFTKKGLDKIRKYEDSIETKHSSFAIILFSSVYYLMVAHKKIRGLLSIPLNPIKGEKTRKVDLSPDLLFVKDVYIPFCQGCHEVVNPLDWLFLNGTSRLVGLRRSHMKGAERNRGARKTKSLHLMNDDFLVNVDNEFTVFMHQYVQVKFTKSYKERLPERQPVWIALNPIWNKMEGNSFKLSQLKACSIFFICENPEGNWHVVSESNYAIDEDEDPGRVLKNCASYLTTVWRIVASTGIQDNNGSDIESAKKQCLDLLEAFSSLTLGSQHGGLLAPKKRHWIDPFRRDHLQEYRTGGPYDYCLCRSHAAQGISTVNDANMKSKGADFVKKFGEEFSNLGNISGRNLAVIFASNGYEDCQKNDVLMSAEKDAENVAEVLSTEYGFEIIHKVLGSDTTQKKLNAILKSDREDSLKQQVGIADNLVVYVACHSFREKDDENTTMYFHDCNHGTCHGFESESFVRSLMQQRARHTFLIVDSCYSGGIGDSERNPPSQRQDRANDRSFVVLAATRPLQTAGETKEGGFFTEELLKALKTRCGRDDAEEFVVDDILTFIKNELKVKKKPQEPIRKYILPQFSEFKFRPCKLNQ